MAAPKEKPVVPVEKRYMQTLTEAAEYFGIGINRLREIAKDPTCDFTVNVGNKKLMIIRPKFEEFLSNHRAV